MPTTQELFGDSLTGPKEVAPIGVPVEPGVGIPTGDFIGTVLDAIGKVPVIGGTVRKGLDFPQTYRNLTSRAGLSGLAESLPGVNTGYKPSTEPEQQVQESTKLLGTVGQAAAGAGLGTVASKALQAPKLATEALQLVGASAPGIAKTGIEGGSGAAGKQALVDLLIGLVSKGTSVGLKKAFPAGMDPNQRFSNKDFLPKVDFDKAKMSKTMKMFKAPEFLSKELPTEVTTKNVSQMTAPDLAKVIREIPKSKKMPGVTTEVLDSYEKNYSLLGARDKVRADQYFQHVWKRLTKEDRNNALGKALLKYGAAAVGGYGASEIIGAATKK
jgi:hypothetical protein